MVLTKLRKVVITISVIKNKQNKTITLIIDQKELDDYLNEYFAKYPSRRVPPVKEPVHPSINKWAGLQRMAQNKLKQDWNNFIVWYIEKYSLSGYQISVCKMECTLTYPTKHRRDPDNYTHKFINDGLVNSGFLVDDSFDNIIETTFKKNYEKGVYKTEIKLEILEMEGEFK